MHRSRIFEISVAVLRMLQIAYKQENLSEQLTNLPLVCIAYYSAFEMAKASVVNTDNKEVLTASG